MAAVRAEGSGHTHDLRGHVIVCGLHGLGMRIIEQLYLAGVTVVVIDDNPDERLLREIRPWAIPCIHGSPRLRQNLIDGGLIGAAAVICVEEGDLATLETALLVRALRPDARLVVQLANAAVGQAVESAVGAGSVLDVASLAAPSIAEACLQRSWQGLPLGGETFQVASVTADQASTLRDVYGDLVPIAIISPDGQRFKLCPGRDEPVEAGDEVVVLGTRAHLADSGIVESAAEVAQDAQHRGTRLRFHRTIGRLIRSVAEGTEGALRASLFALIGLVVLASVTIHLGYRLHSSGKHISALDAIYFTVETVATVGYGDYSFAGQQAWLKAFAVALIIVGAALVTTLFALLTNLLVSRRIAESIGHQRVTRMRGHVVVVGLGGVGVRVVQALVAQGRDVVVIERDPANRHLSEARSANVPVLVADSTLEETFEAANIKAATAVAVLTSNDLTNIETGLALRNRLAANKADIPIILRIFDRRLARIIELTFGLRFVRSTSALAAPWFIGAALGLDVLFTFYVRNELLLVGRLTVAPEGGLAGLAMQDLAAHIRVVAIKRASGGLLEHPPRRDTRFAPGDLAYLIGPYEELIRVLQHDARAGRQQE